jgi:hypothetical protein
MKSLLAAALATGSLFALQGCSLETNEAADNAGAALSQPASLDDLLEGLLPGPSVPIAHGAHGFEKRATVECVLDGPGETVCQAEDGGPVLRGEDAYRVFESFRVPTAGIYKAADVRCVRFLDGSRKCESSYVQPSSDRFSRDDRPVDGMFTELTLLKVTRGYNVTLRTVYYDRIQHRDVDTTKTLGQGLDCTFQGNRISCERDDRPVDGELKVLAMKYDADYTWSATLRTAGFDRFTMTAYDDTVDVASGLER